MDKKIWQYRVKKEDGTWLADVILREDGFFATVSDWGNYSFWWRHHGIEFREFVAGLEKSADYLCSKLERRDWYDAEGTLRNVRRIILSLRRDDSLSKEEARKEYGLLGDVLGAFSKREAHATLEMDLHQFFLWYEQTTLVDAFERAAYDYPPDVRSFCQEVLPLLAAMLRAELAAEACRPTAP